MAESTRRHSLTDDEIRSLCEQELWQASGDHAELSYKRADAMDAYLGEPRGDEVDGRSQIRTRENLETVEWLMPSLMRIFRDADNIVTFDPVGPEDEQAAEQETDAVKHVFFTKNRGFYNLYSFIKDGLIGKTGILKVWWDATPDEEREEYDQLSDEEIALLLGDESVDIEVVEHEQNADGTHRVALVVETAKGKLCIEPTPPEEFGIDRDARSVYPDDAEFVYHRTRKTKSELVETGYERRVVEGLPVAHDTLTVERAARRHLADEQDREQHDHWSMERVWVTECYIRVDRDDDGVAELLKVTLAGADSAYTTGSTLLDIEEVDRQPFVVWSPILLTHKFYGLSAIDLVDDLEVIKTTLMRQVLDSTYLANNGRTAVNERVNLDDLLTSRPGGVVRTEGEAPPGESIMPIPQQPIPPQTFEVMQAQDEARQRRIGVGDEVGTLDPSSLANMNTGVAALAYDAARSKIELMAAVCAEIGIAPLFRRIHELLRKHGGRELSLKLGNEWVQIAPQAWRERTDMTVVVGIGSVSRERKLVALSDVLEKQAMVVQAGAFGLVMLPEHAYNALADYTDTLGLDASRYWQDPRMLPPMPPQSDPAADLAQAQIQLGQAQIQLEGAKMQSNERIKVMELQQKEREMAIRAEGESLKRDLAVLKQERDGAVAEAKVALDAEIKAREQEIRAVEVRLEDAQEDAKREVDIFKALLQAGVTLTSDQMSQFGLDGGMPFERLMQLVQQQGESFAGALSEQGRQLSEQGRQLGGAVADVYRVLEESRAEASAPKTIERDESGRIVAVGGKRVRYGSNGLMEGIG